MVVHLDGHGVGRPVARDVDPREVEPSGSQPGEKSRHISQHDVPQTYEQQWLVEILSQGAVEIDWRKGPYDSNVASLIRSDLNFH